jgi:hypothetical protein
VLPRCWVAERLFAWVNRNRRLAKDFEATIASAKAFLYAACGMLLGQNERNAHLVRISGQRANIKRPCDKARAEPGAVSIRQGFPTHFAGRPRHSLRSG